MRGGFASSVYFFSCQLFTTAPRFENSTRYRSFSTTMVRSSVSALGATAILGAADTLVAGLLEVAPVLGGVTAGLPPAGPGVAGAVCAGRLPCGGVAGGFG